MAKSFVHPDPPPRLECSDCCDTGRCMMMGLVAKALIYAWLEGRAIEGCTFFKPDNYHGLEGVRK